jgi:hypothetical protein
MLARTQYNAALQQQTMFHSQSTFDREASVSHRGSTCLSAAVLYTVPFAEFRPPDHHKQGKHSYATLHQAVL